MTLGRFVVLFITLNIIIFLIPDPYSVPLFFLCNFITHLIFRYGYKDPSFTRSSLINTVMAAIFLVFYIIIDAFFI